MFRQIILFLAVLLTSCDQKGTIVKWGCDPTCEKKAWLTFPYDKALLFTDTSGAIKTALDSLTLAVYIKEHKGLEVKAEDIKKIDEILSCGMWICERTPVTKELYDPEHLIVFTKAGEPVSYIATCYKSKMVKCSPQSDNNEIELMNALLRDMNIGE